MSANQDFLYGKPRNKKKNNEPTASDLVFSSQLSSLISQGATQSSQGRQRPSKAPKSDIFASHNKGSQKRAAADLLDDNRALKQVHQSTQDLGSVNTATLGRSRRRMEEKARMYDDMKKGMYLAGDSDEDDNAPIDPLDPEAYLKRLRRKEKEGLIDFDQKHANEHELKRDESDDDMASVISYEDEFGRSRRGTRAEAAESARAKGEEAGGIAAQERWRPARPDNLIYGEAIQTEAFNPDANIASQMSHLAARRDRSPTPPESTHYNAEAEVRNRGTGFFSFSNIEDERREQMADLAAERLQTINKRQTLEEFIAERDAYWEWRRAEIIKEAEYGEQLRAEQAIKDALNPKVEDPNDMPDPELDFLCNEDMQRPSYYLTHRPTRWMDSQNPDRT